MSDAVPAPAMYVKRRRIKGWKKPAGAISCTRGRTHAGPWGNPFKPGDLVAGHSVVRNHDHAVELYRLLLRSMPDKQRQARTELAGGILMCWCAEGQVCHVQDVLIPLVNEGRLP